jgi:hypothetical protein
VAATTWLVCCLTIAGSRNSYPAVRPLDAPPNEFSEARARVVLDNITAGPHPVMEHSCVPMATASNVRVHQALAQRIRQIMPHANVVIDYEVDPVPFDPRTGSYSRQEIFGPDADCSCLSYGGSCSNQTYPTYNYVAARIRPTTKPATHVKSLLLTGHFDSSPSQFQREAIDAGVIDFAATPGRGGVAWMSPGGADDAMGSVTALEVFRALAEAPEATPRTDVSAAAKAVSCQCPLPSDCLIGERRWCYFSPTARRRTGSECAPSSANHNSRRVSACSTRR